MMKLMHPKPPCRHAVRPGPEPAPAGSTRSRASAARQQRRRSSGELADTDAAARASVEDSSSRSSVFHTKDPFRRRSLTSRCPPCGGLGLDDGDAELRRHRRAVHALERDYHRRCPPRPPSTAVPSSPGCAERDATTTTPSSLARPSRSPSTASSPTSHAAGRSRPAHPSFRLVSWAKGTARIAIVGGTYSTGDPTLGSPSTRR